jgi:glycosyltransferase involved in cell wall biosynthesis
MFTLLVPCNRDHEWLENCFESISSNGPNFDYEILVVVNNASFQVKENITQLRDKVLPKARIVDSGVGTLSDALNFGLINARFEYIARLDSDDELCKNRIETQIDLLDCSPGVSVVGSYTQLISASGERGRVIRFPINSTEIAQRIKYGNLLSHPTVTFRKSTVMQVGMYTNNFPHAEDYELWLKIAEVSKIVNVPIIGTLYRQHGTQISQAFVRDQILATRELAVGAIVKSLMSRKIDVSPIQISQFISPKVIRFRSRHLRVEKGKFEFSQYVAFRNTFTFSWKITTLMTIVLNSPQTLLSWGVRKIRYFLKGRNET